MISGKFRLIAPASTLLAALGASGAIAAQDASDALAQSCNVVSAAGYCGVVFGAKEDAAKVSFHGRLEPSPNLDLDAPEEAACHYLFSADKAGIALMFVGGQFERIDITGPEVSTASGARVGMTLAEVEARYPNAVRHPNFYVSTDIDLVADLGGGVIAYFQFGDDGRVWTFRVGKEKAARFVEGCG